MKKYFFITLLLIISIMFSEQIKLAFGANLRTEPNTKSEKIGKVSDETAITDVLDTYADWAFCQILTNVDNISGKYYIWTGILDNQNIDYNATIIGKGGTLRKEAKTGKSTEAGYIKVKSIVKILNKDVTWYKINYNNQDCWISKINIIKIK